ncbi:hypothetical protein EVAR_83537_1 [Eumeta japonica]|uniref:Uncharacterized protein n=1 Tax=Eumeta variegata TaxID=151549 RepID=A0A4C1ZFQ1_EUMVA|nr:hypothetical protein EVAR_83537_1 [Eumeta japonica]
MEIGIENKTRIGIQNGIAIRNIVNYRNRFMCKMKEFLPYRAAEPEAKATQVIYGMTPYPIQIRHVRTITRNRTATAIPIAPTVASLQYPEPLAIRAGAEAVGGRLKSRICRR